MEINIKAARSERVNYNTPGLPIYFKKGMLSWYPNYAAEKHWHDDIEFIAILSGQMQYNVNGETVTIKTGDGIVVNSRQFHYGFSSDMSECEFLCVLLHPVLLTASQYIEQNYVMPLLNDTSLPYHLLHHDIEWERNILDNVKKIFTASQLESVIIFYQIWNELWKNNPKIDRQSTVKNSKMNVLKNMITFVQNNYKEKVSLADIARSGAVGKTECCNIFKNYTNLTPLAFLNDFRLRKSVELLTETDMTISEICYEVGFSGASYFTETFGKTFGCSPKEYRKTVK